MTEWRNLGSSGGGRDPASVLEVVRQAALANRRIRERSRAIMSDCRALADRARRDLGAARARVEAAEAHAEAAETRARDAEAHAEALERWLNRIEALLIEEFSQVELQVELLAPADPLAAMAGELDAGGRERLFPNGRVAPLGWTRPEAAEGRMPGETEAARPQGVRSAIATLRRMLAGPGPSGRAT
jgi:hypothetical protein